MNNEKYSSQTNVNTAEYYNPGEFKIENVVFVDNVSKFEEMISYFDSHKIDVIGK